MDAYALDVVTGVLLGADSSGVDLGPTIVPVWDGFDKRLQGLVLDQLNGADAFEAGRRHGVSGAEAAVALHYGLRVLAAAARQVVPIEADSLDALGVDLAAACRAVGVDRLSQVLWVRDSRELAALLHTMPAVTVLDLAVALGKVRRDRLATQRLVAA